MMLKKIIIISGLLFTMLNANNDKELKLYNIHTKESYTGIYYKNGMYVDLEIKKLKLFFRDFRTNTSKTIDIKSINSLFDIKQRYHYINTIDIISGYRSKKTNDMLRGKGRKTVKKSNHIVGKAIDFRFRKWNIRRVYNLCLKHNNGGCGLYTKSDFIHLDSGRKRYWGR